MLEQLSAGVVLTGGAVLLQGMSEFAEEILGMPVRIGMPTGHQGDHAARARARVRRPASGLVKYGAQARARRAVARGAGRSPRCRRRARSRAPVGGRDRRSRSKSGFWEWIKAAF